MNSLIIIILVFGVFQAAHCQNVNCNGRSFICVGQTTFIECVEISQGVFFTLNNVTSFCPSGVICNQNSTINSPCVAPPTTTTPRGPVNCNGKGFVCTDTTHYIQCVDIGGGLFITLDNVIQTCIPGTVCNNNNTIECLAPSAITTTTRRLTTTTRRANVTTTTRRSNATTVRSVTQSTCPRTGSFAEPADCHIFYTCAGAVRVTNYCPFGSVFSAALGQCTTNRDACVSPSFNCVINGKFPDPRNCYGFFDCQRVGNRFTVVRQTCGESDTFHSYLGRCRRGRMGCAGKVASVIAGIAGK